jgi:hypothetical protein
MKKQAKKKIVKNPRLSVADVSGELRATFARIGARVETGGSIAAGVRYASSLADGETRRESAPIDWEKETIESLRVFAVCGYDFRIRAAALAEIEYRKDNALVTACNYVSDDVTRISWLSSLIKLATDHIETIMGEDVSAGLKCLQEVQAMHDALKEMLNAIPGVNDGD